MDEELNKLNMEVENLKVALRSLDLQKIKLKREIAAFQEMAAQQSTKIEELVWKIKRAEFISRCEKGRHDQYKSMIDLSEKNLSLHTIFKLEEKPEENDLLQKWILQKSKVSCRLDELQKNNQKVSILISNIRQTLNILQNRNAAIFRKLEKELQETEILENNFMIELQNLEDDPMQVDPL